MRRRFIGILGLAGVTALFVSACGGGAEPTARPPRPTVAPVPSATAPPQPSPTRAPEPAATATPATRPTAAPTAAPTPSRVAPKTGGILNVRDIREWAPIWDTWNNLGGFVPFIGNLVSNLVRYDFDDNAKIVPDLATEWTAAGDGLSYTLKIRQDAAWHDGKPFTAQDVVWNLNRGIKPPSQAIGFNFRKFRSVQSVDAVDAQTVRITMKQPSASFWPSLAAYSVLMYPPHVDMATWQATAIGTGPFKLKAWANGASSTLERYANYHQRDGAGNRLPYLDGMQIFVITDPALAMASFRTGRIDCGCGHDHDFVTTNVETIKKEFPGAGVWLVLADQFNLLFNLEKPPFNNRDVREAFSMFLDRRAIVALPRGGYGAFPPAHMNQPEQGGQWGLPNAELLTLPGFREPFNAEVARANDQLKKAGIDPKTLNLLFSAVLNPNVGPYHEAASGLIQNASGAKIAYRAELSIAWNGTLAAKTWDISMTAGGTSYDDPSAIFLEYVTKDGTRNIAKFDFGVDDLAAQQEATLDFKKRRDIIYEIQRKLIRDASLVPAVYQVDGWATHAYVKGWRAPFLSVGPQNRMERVWLDRR